MKNPLIARRNSAEQSVLGGLMLDNSRWPDIQTLLTEEDFLSDRHKLIFSAIKQQLQAERPADIITISETQGLDLAYVGLLAKDTPSAANIVAYAHIVKQEAERQQAASTLNRALGNINSGQDTAQVMQQIIEHAEKRSINKQGGVMFTHIKEVTVKPIDWLINDFVESHALVEVFGAPESGKSLLAIDWGLSVAAGIPWRGHNTQQSAVFYIAGEGHNGLSRRFSAWGVTNGINTDNLPFFQSSGAVGLYNIESALDAERAIKAALKHTQYPPKLIIIDTLARNFGTGSENSTEDMGLFIAHVDRHLRVKFNCTVLLVHHTGHGAAERGRGSSALKAAVDTEFSLSKNNGSMINLHCTKMKDAAHPAPKSFTIASVNLGVMDEKGHEANGAVLVDALYSPPEPAIKPLADNQLMALDVLERLTDEHRQNFVDEGKNPDDAKVTEKLWREQLGEMKSYNYRNIKDGLVKRGMISLEDGFVYLV